MTARLLCVPELDSDVDTLTAAMAYARSGWYVLPVRRGTKNPGSVVGGAWESKSSRDLEQLVAWFAGTDHGIALHAGRSGAIVFDVDDPTKLPPLLVEHLEQSVPFQTSRRVGDSRRGHYLYRQPKERKLGNSTGKLGKGWGEVRGNNGVIIVAPSVHEKAAEGGFYEWRRVGELPALPDAVADLLPEATKASKAATDEAVEAFLDEHIGSDSPDALPVLIHHWQRKVAGGGSRHDLACGYLTGAMIEARLGAYPARKAVEAFEAAFIEAMGQQVADDDRTLSESMAKAEFAGILSWAVAQAEAAADEVLEKRLEVLREHFVDYEVADWLRGLPGAAPPSSAATSSTDDDTASSTEPPPEQPPAPPPSVDHALDAEVAKQWLQRRARRRVDELEAAQRGGAEPDVATLRELLGRPLEDAWRVHGLLPANGRLLLTAQRKSGKTTMALNLCRSLLDGEEFLGRFHVEPVEGLVAFLNYEVSGSTFATWAHEVGVDPDRLLVVNLRGRGNPLATEAGRAELAALLREHGASVLVVDVFGRAFTGRSQNDAAEVTPWLVRLDEVAEAGGCREVLLTAHAGWDAERTRGSTALEDWPDAVATLTVDPDTGGRFFRAFGRDVDVDEDELTWDAERRTLTLAGSGSRKQAQQTRQTDGLVAAVVELVNRTPSLSTTALDEQLREDGHHFQRGAAHKAARTATERGLIERHKGEKNAWLHYPAGSSPEVSRVVTGTPSSVVPTTPIGGGTTNRTAGTAGCTPEPGLQPAREWTAEAACAICDARPGKPRAGQRDSYCDDCWRLWEPVAGSPHRAAS